MLKRAIAGGRIKPGERLPPEREMATQFGVGRLVVREALRTLESQGWVVVKRGFRGGSFVCEPTTRDISHNFSNMLHLARISLADLLEVRLELEGAIMELAARRATNADLKALQDNLTQTRELLGNGSPGAAQALRDKVHEFHSLLAACSKNALYMLMTNSIVDVISHYMNVLRVQSIVSRSTVEEHETIYQFLSRGNTSKALEALRRHIVKDNLRLTQRAAKRRITHIEYLSSV